MGIGPAATARRGPIDEGSASAAEPSSRLRPDSHDHRPTNRSTFAVIRRPPLEPSSSLRYRALPCSSRRCVCPISHRTSPAFYRTGTAQTERRVSEPCFGTFRASSRLGELVVQWRRHPRRSGSADACSSSQASNLLWVPSGAGTMRCRHRRSARARRARGHA